jgi:transposase InsO family protein
LALVELSVVEQRYRAVLEVQAGIPVTEVAAALGVSRQSVHAWIRRYKDSGLAGLMDRPKRPESCPHQVSAQIEAVVCELRREHPRWGPLRLAHELGRAGVVPVPSRMSVYRVLVRHGLIDPQPRKRPKDSYLRWEREAPMALWQLDIVGGAFLADGTEAKIVTGVDDHSRYCVICQVVVRATGRAVCLAFAGALRRYGVPGEVLTDNGKQFTDRFGGHGARNGEVLFDKICRKNGITHRLTAPASPNQNGKVERFHGTLRPDFLDVAGPFTSVDEAQAAVNAWVAHYNADRPHQALDEKVPVTPADRFAPVPAAQRDLVNLWLPAALDSATAPASGPAEPRTGTAAGPPVTASSTPRGGGPVEFDRVVPPSGNLQVAGKQFWLGPALGRTVIRFWADCDLIHLSAGGARIKTLRSHLSPADLARLAANGAVPAGPSPLPPAAGGQAVEVERPVSRGGLVSLGGHRLLAAEILGGQLVGIRIEPATLMFFDPATRVLLRTRPNPLTAVDIARLRGARPAGPAPQPSAEPVQVQRRASATGVIMIAGQKIALGRIHAGQTVTVLVSDASLTVESGDGEARVVRRTTTQPVRSVKGQRPRTAATIP